MQFSQSSKEIIEKEAVCVCDIGTGSVGVGIVLTNGNSESRIAVTKRMTLSLEERDEEHRIVAIVAALGAAGKEALDAYTASAFSKEYGAPQRVYATFHVPWVLSEARETTHTFTTPTRITRGIIAQAGKENGKQSESLPTRFKQLEWMVMRVELNGYPTHSPLGKVARSMRVSVLESSIVDDLYTAVQHILETLLPNRIIRAHSAIFVYNRAIRECVPDHTECLFLDMSSEATACAVFEGNGIARIGNVPVGFRTLLRAAAAAGNTSIQETLSMIRMIGDDTCSDDACRAAAEAMSKAEIEYVHAFKEVFRSLAEENKLPNVLCMCVHPRLASWATGFFSRLDFGQFTENGKPFRVQVISSRTLADIVVYTKEARPDEGIGASAALVHIEKSL